MTSSFPNGRSCVTIQVMEDEDGFEEFIEVTSVSDIAADAATVIEMAALMLDERGGREAYVRGMEVPLSAVPSTLALATSMIATLAERLAVFEGGTAEEILLELRTWHETWDEGDDDGRSGV